MTNITDKPFKKHNQQMRILRSRNLEVKSNDKRDLEQIGYYALINGYKWPFLRRGPTTSAMTFASEVVRFTPCLESTRTVR